MNFLLGGLERRDGNLWFRGPAVEQLLPPGHEAAIASDRSGLAQSVILGIRPHDIAVRPPTSAANEGWKSRARATLTEPVGPVTYVDFDLGGQTIRASASADVQVERDDVIEFRFNEGALHLFDASTGARLSQNVSA
jgi:multiple sugar transport system ATP-binding protein